MILICSLTDDDKLICLLDKGGMPAQVSIKSHYEDVDFTILVANAPFQVSGLTDCWLN